MSGDGAAVVPPSAESAPLRWWSIWYATRLGIALLLASVFVGAVLGPANLLLNQLETSWAGGSLWYPDWMYWQAALLQIVPGALIAGGASFAAVLLSARPATGRVVAMRLLVGPIIAGLLLAIISLLWGGSGLPRVLVMTAIACSVFAAAGMLARVTKVELGQRGAATSRVS